METHLDACITSSDCSHVKRSPTFSGAYRWISSMPEQPVNALKHFNHINKKLFIRVHQFRKKHVALEFMRYSNHIRE